MSVGRKSSAQSAVLRRPAKAVAFGSIGFEVRGAVALVALARPEVHNAFDETLIAELTAALGGVGGLVACCDIAIGAHDATFAFSEARLGLIPATIAPYVIEAIGARQ